MQVTSGSEWAQPGSSSGNRRSWSISLNDDDGAQLAGDRWDEMSWTERREFLQKRADLEVLLFMYREGVITKDYLQHRAAEIKS